MSHLFVLVPSIYLFCLGLFGIYHKRHNLISTLMAIEIMLLGISVMFVGFSNLHSDLEGQIITIFILATSAAEVSIGLAIMVVYYKEKGNILIENMNKFKG